MKESLVDPAPPLASRRPPPATLAIEIIELALGVIADRLRGVAASWREIAGGGATLW